MGKRVLHTHKQRSGKPALRVAGLLGMALLCLPLASAAGRNGLGAQDGIAEIAVAGVGVQDLTSMAVLAQAAAPGATPTADYVLQQCQETETYADSTSALRGVDPAGWLAVYLGNRDGRNIYGDPAAMALIKITMLEGTKHGTIIAGVSTEGRTVYLYDATPDYVGKDRAIFMAEFNGKRYKIVIDLVVSAVADERLPVCPPPKLIKVNGRPVSDSSDYQLNSFTITFGDLPGSAVGLGGGVITTRRS